MHAVYLVYVCPYDKSGRTRGYLTPDGDLTTDPHKALRVPSLNKGLRLAGEAARIYGLPAGLMCWLKVIDSAA